MKAQKLLFILISLCFASCKNEVVKQPKNLIAKDVMINIIYDLSVLEAAKTQTMGMQNNYPKATDFIKAKYKVDSITFAQSTQYYASDVKEYKKMYDQVKEKLNKESTRLSGGKSYVPDTSQGVVK